MPVVLLIDVSLSMARSGTLHAVSQQPPVTRASLAAAGVSALLDHLSAHSRLEFVSLIAFSSLYEVICGFTRDYEFIKQKLRQLEEYDKTSIENALNAAYSIVLAEWGHQTHTHIILVTDGSVGSLSNSIMTSSAITPSFPCTLNVVCIAQPNDPALISSTPYYRRLIERASNGNGGAMGSLHIPELPLTVASVCNLFRRLGTDHLGAWRGVLKCGSLESRIVLAPAPLPYTHVSDFDSIKLTMPGTLEISGFISMQDIGSPTALSRHLILPAPPINNLISKTTNNIKNDSNEISLVDDDCESSKTPNFCVLLHGAIKVENMAAIVQLDEDWYGVIHSWADSKKKANLMLSVLPYGDDAIPWLGPLNQLGPIEANDSGEVFPIRSTEKKSYSGTGNIWVRPAGLQADLQKLLRTARKLPEKTHHFYKEVNRVRRAALALGWVEALGALAHVLEREASLLSPAAAQAISVAIHHLRDTSDPKLQLPFP